MLFGLAWISAAALTWFLYAKTQVPKVEKRITVMAAARDMPLGTLLKKTDLRAISLLEKDVPKGAAFSDREAVNRVLLYPASTNEPLLLSKLSGTTTAEGVASTIERGSRAVAVPITDTSAVGGLLQPGSRVDVLFTRPGSMTEAITTTVLQNVRVLSIGRTISVASGTGAVTETKAQPAAQRNQVVTLVLNPADAQKLELAKNQGKISLALRNPLDDSPDLETTPITTESLDPMVSARIARARRGRTTNISRANLDDPRVWQELTGEKKFVDPDKEKARLEEEARKKREAEKPRVIVDIFRGEKHVQEMFR
jgi:pilus assembly protein CpaB